MLDIQTNLWIEITFIEGFEPRCTLSNILYGIMYRFRVIAYNDAGPSEAGDPSEPVVIDVPGVQIAPYFVLMLNDTIALEHEKVEFKIKVLGTPKPSIQWFKDDLEVGRDIKNELFMVSLRCSAAIALRSRMRKMEAVLLLGKPGNA